MLIPCICCHRCWTSYTLPEWAELAEQDEAAAPAGVERRICRCGEPLTADVAGLSLLNLDADPVAYAQDFPGSGRPAQWARAVLADLELRRRRRSLAAAVLAVALALAAGLALGGWPW